MIVRVNTLETVNSMEMVLLSIPVRRIPVIDIGKTIIVSTFNKDKIQFYNPLQLFCDIAQEGDVWRGVIRGE